MFSEVSAKDNLYIDTTMLKLLTHMHQQKNSLENISQEIKQIKRRNSTDFEMADSSHKSQIIFQSNHFEVSHNNSAISQVQNKERA
jgi:hypothetical protein